MTEQPPYDPSASPRPAQQRPARDHLRLRGIPRDGEAPPPTSSLPPPACCESGLSLRQHQVSCEACTVWARQAFVAELALHAGMGEGAGMAAGAEIWAKYRGRLGRARATA